MAKFKVGQKVKLVKFDYEGWAKYDNLKIGKIYTVKKVSIKSIKVKEESTGFWIDYKCFSPIKGKYKEPKVNFLLKYDLEEDPIEEYETIEEVEKRIKELVDEEDSLDEESIIVYDVSRVRKISLKKELVISGL